MLGTSSGGAFHYGTHYMCAAYVLHFLVRLRPFAQAAVQLQGQRSKHGSRLCFEKHPDRLFHSLAGAWRSAAGSNTHDVRELLPEFFYMPEFLRNRGMVERRPSGCRRPLPRVVLPRRLPAARLLPLAPPTETCGTQRLPASRRASLATHRRAPRPHRVGPPRRPLVGGRRARPLRCLQLRAAS